MQSIASTPHGLVPPSAHTWPQTNKTPTTTLSQCLAPNVQPHAERCCQLLASPGACVVLTGPSGVGKSALLNHALSAPDLAGVIQSSHHLWRATAVKGVAGLQACLGEHSSRQQGDWSAQITAWCRAKRAVVWVIKGAHHLDDQQLAAMCDLAAQAKACAAPMRVVLMGKPSLAGRLKQLSHVGKLAFAPSILALSAMTMQQSQQFVQQHMAQHGVNMATMGMDQLIHMHQQAAGLPRALCRMVAAYSKAHMQALTQQSKPELHVVELGWAWCKRHPISWCGLGVMATFLLCALHFHVQPLLLMSAGEHAKHWANHIRARTSIAVATRSPEPMPAVMVAASYVHQGSVRT